MALGVHVHTRLCARVYEFKRICANVCSHVHISSRTDEDDRCGCIRAWVCVVGRRGEEGGERRLDMGAQ